MSNYDIYPLNGFSLTGEFGDSEDEFFVDTLTIGNSVYIFGNNNCGYIPGYENIRVAFTLRVEVDTFVFKPYKAFDDLSSYYIDTPIYEFSSLDIENMLSTAETLYKQYDNF